jgi:hypothetical protein
MAPELPERRPIDLRLSYYLASAIGWSILGGCALLLGRGSIPFVLLAFVFMDIGRRLGWLISRYSLYADPTPVVLIELVAWGAIVAYLMHVLITWQQPNWIVKWIFGFGLGAYVSVPNYGLFASLPSEALPRDAANSNLSLFVFIVCMIAFSYLL